MSKGTSVEGVAMFCETREIPIDSLAVFTGESSSVVFPMLGAIYAVATVAAIRWHGGRDDRDGLRSSFGKFQGRA